MARAVVVGPLRMWAEHGSGGDVLICEHEGTRYRYPRSDLSGRSRTAWQVYRERDVTVAWGFGFQPDW